MPCTSLRAILKSKLPRKALQNRGVQSLYHLLCSKALRTDSADLTGLCDSKWLTGMDFRLTRLEHGFDTLKAFDAFDAFKTSLPLTRALHFCAGVASQVGTAGAMQVPVVGLQPLRSVEQPWPHFALFWLPKMSVFKQLQYSRRCHAFARATHPDFSSFSRFCVLCPHCLIHHCSHYRLGPLMVFVGYQVLAFCDWQRRRRLSRDDKLT